MPNTSDLLSKVQQANLYFANLMNEYVDSFVYSMERDERINAKVNDLYELLEAMDFQLAKDLYYDNENTKLIYQKIDCITPIYNTYITIDTSLIKPFISNTIQSQAAWGGITGDINNQQDLIGLFSLKQNNITLTTTGTSGAATLIGATLNIPQYTDQFVGTVTSVGLTSATSGVTIGSSPITTSGNITLAIATASGSQNGLLSSTDWTTFNNKQGAITLTTTGSSGASTLIGNTLNIPNYASALTGYVTLDTTQTITGAKTFGATITSNRISATATGDGAAVIGAFAFDNSVAGSFRNTTTLGQNTPTLFVQQGGDGRVAVFEGNTSTVIIESDGDLDGVKDLTLKGSIKKNVPGFIYTYDLPNANGTIALVGGAGVGTVTSVAALTLGTTGTDLSSTVANSTTTPVITLNVPTASATNRGALSSTDWSTFNAKQPAGNYITSLTGEATASGPGAASVTLDNTAVIGKVLTGLNITGGTVASTDSILTALGKVQNQINGLIGGSIFQGTWDASTNTPALASGVGTNGYYYIVSVDGSTNLDGITDWKVGDWAIFAGTTWEKVDNTDSVASVNGYTGTVSLVTGDVLEGAGSLPSRPSQLYFTDARARAAISLTTSGSSGASTYDNGTGVLNIPNYGSALTAYVPYTGATTDVDLGTHSLLAESITLDSTPATIPTAQGSMYFDEDEETLAVILNGTTQKVGEDVFFQIKNQTGVTIPKGTAVRFDGVVGASGRLLAVPFLADGTYSSLYFLGVTSEAILEGDDGKAYITGKVNNLNTNAYTIGTVLYCSTTVAGGFQTTPPIAPNNIISVAVVIAQSATVGKLLIRPQLGSNINNDEGVKIVSGVTGDLLQLQDSGLWENKTVPNVMSNYVTLDTTQTITGAKTFSSDIAVNGVNIGRGGGNEESNTRVGKNALIANTTGIQNTANGYFSLFNNTTGYNNTAFGHASGDNNTTGYNNIFVGMNSNGESATENNRTWIGNTDTTSTWLGGNLLLGNRNNATSDKLQVTGSAKITGIITLGTGADSYVYDSAGSLILQTGASARLTIDTSGNTTLSGTLSGTSATFSGTYTHTGGNNTIVSQSNTATTGYQYHNMQSTSARLSWGIEANPSANIFTGTLANAAVIGSSSATGAFQIATASTVRATIDPSGNLGLGVTPSAWFSTWRAIEIGGADSNVAGNGSGPFRLLRNAFIDAGGTWIYKNTGEASFYQQSTGNHSWFTAPSGTAGNAISFTPAMTLTAGGNLGISTASPNFKTHISTGDTSSITQPTAGTYGLYIQQNTSGNVGGLYIQDGASNSGNSIYVGDNNGSARFVVNTDGNVLIGTTTDAGYKLDVNGTGRFSGDLTVTGILKLGSFNGAFHSAGVNYFYSGNTSAVITNQSGTSDLVTILNTGAATFSSSVSAGNTPTIGTVFKPLFQVKGITGFQAGYGIVSANDEMVGGLQLTSSTTNSLQITADPDNLRASTDISFSIDGTQVGVIAAGTGVYTPLSDINKKKDFEKSQIGLNAILGLKPTLYRMKTDANNTDKHLGFIAQEVKEFIPQAYSESSDFIGLDFNPIVAALVKAIQELNEKITQLENK
jgi:hypothetical protein